MKIAFFDCFSGASGDMILGALVDAGVSIDDLREELGKLSLDGFTIEAEKTEKKNISGTRVIVNAVDTSTHRHLSAITKIIESSKLNASVKKTAIDIFNELARAEAKIHNTTIEKIHFHEVGAIDAIVDIVGASICLHLLGIEQVFVSRIHVGTGFVDCQHGRMPVPAPATLELLRGIPVYSEGIEAELITPTGAAILKTIGKRFGSAPNMKILSTGYGAGTRDLPIPNLLRVWIGEIEQSAPDEDEVILIETNVDNMNPELLAHATLLLQTDDDVLDLYVTPIMMKKNRAATKVSLIVTTDSLDRITNRIFKEISTLGVRYQKMRRKKLYREIIKVQTEFGEIEVKIGKMGNEIMNIHPEFENCRSIAASSDVSIGDVFDAAIISARKELYS